MARVGVPLLSLFLCWLDWRFNFLCSGNFNVTKVYRYGHFVVVVIIIVVWCAYLVVWPDVVVVFGIAANAQATRPTSSSFKAMQKQEGMCAIV